MPKLGPTVLRRLHQQAAEMRGRIAAYKDERAIHTSRMEEVRKAAAEAESICARGKAEIDRLDGLIRGISGQLAKINAKLPPGNGKG